MLGTSLVVGWFIAMTLAKKDGIDQQEAGTIYMWTAVWSIIGSRLLYVITNVGEFDSSRELLDGQPGRSGRVRRHDRRLPRQLVLLPQARHPALLWADVAAPSVVLGTAITRVGCLLFGCDFGGALEPALGDPLPAAQPAGPRHPPWRARDRAAARGREWSFPVHPTQIYESLVGPVPVRDADADPQLPDVLGPGVPGLGARLRHPPPADRDRPRRRPAR